MKSLQKQNVYLIAMILLVTIVLSILFRHKLFLLKPTPSISQTQIKELSVLGSNAIPSLDVPVASLLVYQNQIIGRGYNTVNLDTNVTAHAEVNAINSALRLYGFEKFKQLDRDQLKLITTFEPCAICRAVIIGCNIRHVEFIKAKPLMHLWKEDLKQYRYEWQKNNVGPKNLQDSLFNLHPLYHPQNKD
jgi:tRNA(Arg) A34 adenosine deaminase TadA